MNADNVELKVQNMTSYPQKNRPIAIYAIYGENEKDIAQFIQSWKKERKKNKELFMRA